MLKSKRLEIRLDYECQSFSVYPSGPSGVPINIVIDAPVATAIRRMSFHCLQAQEIAQGVVQTMQPDRHGLLQRRKQYKPSLRAEINGNWFITEILAYVVQCSPIGVHA